MVWEKSDTFSQLWSAKIEGYWMHLELWRIYSLTPWLRYQYKKNQKGLLGHKTAVLLSSTTWTLKGAMTWCLSCAAALDDPQNGRKCLQPVLNLSVFVREKILPKCSECHVWLVISADIIANCCQGNCLPRRCWMSGLCNAAQDWTKETAAQACEVMTTCDLCITAAASIRAPAGRPSEGINGFKSRRCHRC